jgi:DNA-3-methyladenine glycosylase
MKIVPYRSLSINIEETPRTPVPTHEWRIMKLPEDNQTYPFAAYSVKGNEMHIRLLSKDVVNKDTGASEKRVNAIADNKTDSNLFRDEMRFKKVKNLNSRTEKSLIDAIPKGKTLSRDFYSRNTETVALELLGKHLAHRSANRVRIGRIVEVEAYLGPHDPASHSARGMTPRTRVMFGPPGYAYVYLVYGIHHCMNVVTEPKGHGAAVLIRALEPVYDINSRTSGPGLLCRAMGIDRRLNGYDLCGEALFITEANREPFAVTRRPRIGVDYAGEWAKKPLRFYIRGNPNVSHP